MAGSLLNLGAFIGGGNDPSQFFVSTAATATGGSPLFDPGALGKYAVIQGTPGSIPYTGGLAKNGTRVYQLVKLDPAATATFGAALIWKDYSDYLVTTVGSTTRQNQIAGALVAGSITAAGAVTSKTIDSTNGNYIFMAVDGLFPALYDATAVTIDNLVFASSATAGTFLSGVNYVTTVTTIVVGKAVTAKAAVHQGITTTGNYAHTYFNFPKLVSF